MKPRLCDHERERRRQAGVADMRADDHPGGGIMTEPTIDELKRAFREAFNQRMDIEFQLSAEIQKSTDAANAQFAEPLRMARAAEVAAERALGESLAAESVRANEAMFTGILIEWAKPGRSYENRPMAPTGKRGRYEIRTPQTEVQHRSHLPGMGQKFIRNP